MKINIKDPRVKVVGAKNLDLLWAVFKEYHDEISVFKSEQPLYPEENFKSFWSRPDNLAIILYSDQEPVGFTLLQKIKSHKINRDYLEVGAIFLKKKYRKGFNGNRLYGAIMDIGKQLNLPIASEMAGDNDTSIKLARLLAKRYMRQNGTGILKETKLENGRLFIFFDFL